MKNYFSYTLIAFFTSIFIFWFGAKDKVELSEQYQNVQSETDTNIRKLPEGYQYISNFILKKKYKVNSITQDSSGLMLFSDNRSITIFDGKNEQYITVDEGPEIIKKSPNNNQIYVACRRGFGKLSKKENGNIYFESLSEKRNHEETYSDIIFTDKKVYFISNEKIVSVKQTDPESVLIEHIDSEKKIDHVFLFNDKLWMNIRNKGFYILEKDTIIKAKLRSDVLIKDIIFSIVEKNSVLFGTVENEILNFNGKQIKRFETSSDDYIKESIITGGVNFNNDYFVVNTLNGGALLIRKDNGDTDHTINYRTGLPDDEVISSFVCLSNALWISHEYGISRVAFDIPVKNFGNYPGIQGKINTVKIIDSTLYVATGEGLFYLSEIKSYDEVKVATDKWVKSMKIIKKTEPDIVPVIQTNTNDDSEVNEESEETGFFKRWKNRKKKQKEENEWEENNAEIELDENNEAPIIPDERPKNDQEKYKTEYRKVTKYRKIYELQSVKYSFKKIENINSKCKKLIEFDEGLVAITNSGLYFISGNKAEVIIPDAYIYSVSKGNTGKNTFVSTSEGLFIFNRKNGVFRVAKIENQKNEYYQIKYVYKLTDSTFWAGYRNKLFLLKIKNNHIRSSEYFTLNTTNNGEIIISEFEGKTVFVSNDNAFYFNEVINDFSEENELKVFIQNAERFFFTSDSSFTIFMQNNAVKNINSNNLPHIKYAKLFDYTEDISVDNHNNIWVVSRDNMIYKIFPEDTSSRKFQIEIYDVTDNEGNSLNNFQDINTQSDYKKINIHLVSPCFLKRDPVQYYFGIDTEDEDEFIRSSESMISIPELTPGNHFILIFALNEIGEKSNLLKIRLSISPPFWQSKWFIIGAFAVFVLILSLSISGFYRRKQRKIREYNEILELKVKERTAEIQKQNKLIQDQNSEIIEQNSKIVTQNNEITGSIRYAGKIQNAALPEFELYKHHINGFFILYKPRDIVSGDFYWITEIQNKFFVAAVDCTGHGVPGGFLSMLGISFLNEIVKDLARKTDNIKAADILNQLRKKIIITLNQQADEMSRDGMDMGMVIFDKEKMILNFAGANNPSYIIREGKIHKLDADRMPIGYNRKLNDTPFSNKFLQVQKNDLIYLFSDGYADQFGGNSNKKFNSRRFRELLLHLQKFPMEQQQDIANKIFQKWQKDNIQIDDVLLIGLEI